MFIGGSPGSTAGGVKTTTLAILFQSIVSILKGQRDVIIYDRLIPSILVLRVIALTFVSILTCSLFIFFFMIVEPEQNFLNIFFETISAFGTVGLSLGITPVLSTIGKFALAILMLIGRLGPLTLVVAVGSDVRDGKIGYPDSRIMIG